MADDMIPLEKGSRIMAHEIVADSMSYRLCIAEITSDGELHIFPFTGEIPSVQFVNGRVEMVCVEGNWYYKKSFNK